MALEMAGEWLIEHSPTYTTRPFSKTRGNLEQNLGKRDGGCTSEPRVTPRRAKQPSLGYLAAWAVLVSRTSGNAFAYPRLPRHGKSLKTPFPRLRPWGAPIVCAWRLGVGYTAVGNIAKGQDELTDEPPPSVRIRADGIGP